MIHHGFRKLTEHTVIQGAIHSIEECSDSYYIQFVKARRKKIGGDFDDMGRKKFVDTHYYNKASNND